MDGPVEFSGRTLRVGSTERELEYPIADAFRAATGVVVVLFRYDADLPKYASRQFANLFALSPSGERRWLAELPTTGSDAYVAIASRDPLVATSWSGYACTLAPRDGRIVRAEFTK